MRYAIISDIHSNIESLQTFLPYLSKLKIEKIMCLGDMVGYYTNPNECIEIVSAFNNLEIVRGNHDRAITEKDYDHFSDYAREAIVWTNRNISQTARDFLNKIPKGPKVIDDSFVICHGSAVDEDNYLLAPIYAKADFVWLKENNIKLLFFGHTHYQTTFFMDQNDNIQITYAEEINLNPDFYYLINPGAVGQPRDGDPRASFAVYDSESKKVNIIRYEYPYEMTRKKVINNHLPRFLGERLEYGR